MVTIEKSKSNGNHGKVLSNSKQNIKTSTTLIFQCNGIDITAVKLTYTFIIALIHFTLIELLMGHT